MTSHAPSGAAEPAAWMGIGTAVTLLPVDVESGFLRGQITHWLGAAGGSVATIGVQTSPKSASLCAGRRLWLCGHEAGTNDLLVLEVVAKRPRRFVNTALAMTGVVPVAHEQRRAAVRAPIRHPVRIGLDDGTLAIGTADDLSRTSCRVSLNRLDQLPSVGDIVGVLIELPGEVAVSLTGNVVRSVPLAAEFAVRFHPTDIDLAPIDRLVYATVRAMPKRDH
jgi:hypothetical protein